MPWGISESAYDVVDRHGTFQYKAFGVPGLGLKRGLGDDLVVAPYASALAAVFEPVEAAKNLRHLVAVGALGEYGFVDAIDYSDRGPDHDTGAPPTRDGTKGRLVPSFFAHHQGMVLVALANALHDDVMVRRFHADPRVQATELLLQERLPRRTLTIEPRPLEEMRAVPPPPVVPVRRYRTAHTSFPHAQFLSNGRAVSIVTNAGGGHFSSGPLAVTRSRRDETTDPAGACIYLRDARTGHVWSATHNPVGVAAGDRPRHVPAGPRHLPAPRRRHRHAARHRGLHRRRRRGPPPHARQSRRARP